MIINEKVYCDLKLEWLIIITLYKLIVCTHNKLVFVIMNTITFEIYTLFSLMWALNEIQNKGKYWRINFC